MLAGLLALARDDNEDWLERRIAVEELARAVGVPLVDVLQRTEPWPECSRKIRQRAEMRLSAECRRQRKR